MTKFLSDLILFCNQNSGFTSAILTLFTLFWTLVAMFAIDGQNKKRWQNDFKEKEKSDIIFNFLLLNLKVNEFIDNCIRNQCKSSNVKIKIENINKLKELRDLSYRLHIIADLDSSLEKLAVFLQDYYFKLDYFFKIFEDLYNKHGEVLFNLEIEPPEFKPLTIKQACGIEIELYKNQSIVKNVQEFLNDIELADKEMTKYFKHSYN